MNEPQFEIYGYQRRELKKELASLKSFAKNFWYCHQIDKDMVMIHGNDSSYLMDDEQAKRVYDGTIERINQMASGLTAPYKQ
jgi:hypothetical protein